MNGPVDGFARMRLLQGVVIFVFVLLVGRLAWLQLFDSRYEELAKANVLRHVVQYPSRCPPWKCSWRRASAHGAASGRWRFRG